MEVGLQLVPLRTMRGRLAVKDVNEPDRPATNPGVALRPVHHGAQLRDGVDPAAAHTGMAVLPDQVVRPPPYPLHPSQGKRSLVQMFQWSGL